MTILTLLLCCFVDAHDMPETINHVKFDFFYKVQFVPQDNSESVRLPMDALTPVVIPTVDYHFIQRIPADQGDLDHLIWLFDYWESPDSEAMVWHRKLVQPGQFNIENLHGFKLAINGMSELRNDLINLADKAISKVRKILYAVDNKAST
ncbi:MAG: hypothetical protein KF798_01785 [Candidatus Paracaedibacteraceae bacterium]|nr:hypothetical protein [Candidatus Paracaedibacteraceae bacterium]